MTLIADSGATNTAWCLIQGSSTEYFHTEGYHPFFVDRQYISHSLSTSMPPDLIAHREGISQIYFYSTGAGYSTATDAVLRGGVTDVFPQSSLYLETDLLAAARSLLQEKAGLTVILGTGCNSGLYDGSRIVQNIESGGFLLGDEGSGSYLGKLLISSFIRGSMPDPVRRAFRQAYQLSPAQLITEVYSARKPNQYCAQYATFAGNHQEDPFCKKLIIENFDCFFKKILSGYGQLQDHDLYAVGSVAYYLREHLENVARSYGMNIGNVASSVINGLVKYHQNSNTMSIT